jgi:bacillithiol biosynthesis cysteine-adding enzyme BshC
MTGVDSRQTTLEFDLARYPGMSRFALDLVARKEDASRFCRTIGGEQAGARRAVDAAFASALARSNAAWGNDVDALVSTWAEGGAVAVVAGQQVGFGGGPVYTIAKIASLLALARRMSERGTPTIPFFWLATEDHDYAEIASLLFQSGLELTYFSAAAESSHGRQPVGGLPVPETLRAALAAKLGDDPRWLRPEINFRDSFAELITDAVGPGQLVLVDSLLPELRSAGEPLFRAMAERLPEIETSIDASSQDLADAGYRAQVTRRRGAGYSLLYTLERHGGREPVETHDNGVSIAGRRRTVADLLQRIGSSPETISTGVLARPLLQDFLFQPAVFVGGPAEVSYYAQLAGVHRMLNLEPPAIALRAHQLVAPARRLGALDRYGFDVTRLFEPLDQTLAAGEVEAGKRIDRLGMQARNAIEEMTKGLEDVAGAADPSLARSLRKSSSRAGYHIEKMKARSRAATARLDAERWRALSKLQSILYPRGSVQDRVAGWIGWWCLWRHEFVPRLVAEAEPDSSVAKVIGF